MSSATAIFTITTYHHHILSKLNAATPSENIKNNFDIPEPSHPIRSSDLGSSQSFRIVGASIKRSTIIDGIIA